MAIKVSLENNILKIDNGVKIKYLNSAWCSMEFSTESVQILNEGEKDGEGHIVPFTEFQDGAGTPINTEAAIATYLSDKIG